MNGKRALSLTETIDRVSQHLGRRVEHHLIRRWVHHGRYGIRLAAGYDSRGHLIFDNDELETYLACVNSDDRTPVTRAAKTPPQSWQSMPLPAAPPTEDEQTTTVLDWQAVARDRLRRYSESLGQVASVSPSSNDVTTDVSVSQ